MIGFAEPAWLYGLAAVAVLFALTIYAARRNRLERVRVVVSGVLRAAALTCLCLALAGPLRKAADQNLEVMFVLDRSHSLTATQEQAARDFADSALRNDRTGVSGGVTVFGADAVLEAAIRPLGGAGAGLGPVLGEVSRDATDIGRAIEVALSGFEGSGQRRIVLLTDGNENRGNGLAGAAVARSMGVSVNVVALPEPDAGDEVYAESLRTPDEVRTSEPFELRLNVGTSREAPVTVTFLRNGQVLRSQTVELAEGINTVSLIDQIETSGLVEYEAIVSSDGDTVAENNRFQSFVRASGAPRVLYAQGVSSAGAGPAYLADALRTQGFDVAFVVPSQLPGSLHELVDFDLVILDNVAGFDLSVNKMEVLERYVRNTGGGLLSVGGDRSYGAGGYFDTPLERLLPVDMDIKTEVKIPSAAVIVLVDKSGSMLTGEKLEIGKASALAAVDILNPLDRVGVIAFDAEHEWTVPMTDAGNRRQIVERLRGLTPGGSTRLYPALVAAYETLLSTEAKIKHLIILSDGLTDSGDDYPELSEQIIDAGITVSTVSLGSDSDQALMATLAQQGGGRYYHTEDPSNVPRIFTRETLIATRDLMVDEPTAVGAVHRPEALRGLDLATLPVLLGYQRTYPKAAAEVWLANPGGDPILAAWRFGLGQAAAFMSDFSGRWGRDWVEWSRFEQFSGQLARWLMRKSGAEKLNARFERDGQEAAIVIDALDADDRFINGLNLNALVLSPDGTQRDLTLEQVAPGRYRGPLAVADAGRYYVTVSDPADGAVTPKTFGLAVPYSSEYVVRGVDRLLLERIAQVSGGALLPLAPSSLDSLYAADEDAGARDASFFWPLAVAALVLVLLDLAARKLTLPRWLRRRQPDDEAVKRRAADFNELAAEVDAMRERELGKLIDTRDLHPRHGEATNRARLYVSGARKRAS